MNSTGKIPTRTAGLPATRSRCTARVHVRGPDFAVYDAAMALTATSKESRVLRASRETLAEMTGYVPRTVGKSREQLVKDGWLVPLSTSWHEDQRRSGKEGTFSVPQFRVIEHSEWAESHRGKCLTEDATTEDGPTVLGQTEDGRTTTTVDGPATDTADGGTCRNALSLSLSIKPEKEKPAADAAAPSRSPAGENGKLTGKKAENFGNPKISRAKPKADPRHAEVILCYAQESAKRFPGLRAPLDGSDGKAVQNLLRQQPEATADQICVWLRNAFDSDDVPPLHPGFRLREFASHFLKYTRGPLRRGGQQGRGYHEQASGKFASVPVH